MGLENRQIELSNANNFIAKYHRHHKKVVGHRYSIATGFNGNKDIVGVAIVGRPVARACDIKTTVEVTRLCTDGTKNACSFLYSLAARIAKELGYKKIQTYILDSEDGTSLRASGWQFETNTYGRIWKHTTGPRRSDQPNCNKQRWAKILN